MLLVRWGCLSALLVAEVFALTLRFDTASLEKGNSWLISLAGKSPVLPQLLLAVFTASALIAGTTLLKHLRTHTDLIKNSKGLGKPLILHLSCFALLYWISLRLFSGNIDVLNSFFWPIAWILAILAVAFSWARMLVPGSVYLLLVTEYRKQLLASVVLGVFGWGVGQYAKQLFSHLGYATFWCCNQIMNLIAADTVSDWDTRELGTSTFSVLVDKACSGYEGIGLILIFLAAYLWLSRDTLRFPRALLLLPVGVLTAWLMNCLRICVLILVGTYFSADIAAGGFHSIAGGLLFCCVALGLAWATHHIHWINKLEKPKAPDPNSSKTAAYIAPFMAILAVGMITGLFTAEFNYLYPVHILVASILLRHYRRYYSEMRFNLSWFSVAAGIGVFLVWVALAPAPPDSATATFSNSLKTLHPLWAALWLFFRIIGTSIVVPLVEEISFRGYLTRRIISAEFSKIPQGQFSWLSFILSSVIFGSLHQRWGVGIFAGLVYALVLYRRRNLADAVIAHATTNLALSIYILFTQRWDLWM